MGKGPVRHIRLRAVVAYPAVALVAALTLAITPFSSAQGMTLAVLPTPTDTLAAAAVPTTADAATAAPTSLPTTDAPTSAPTTDTPASVPTTAADTLPPTSGATTAPNPVPNPTPGVDPSLAPVLGAAPVDHHVLAPIVDAEAAATYLTVDAPASDASQFQTFRVRFQLHNDGTAPITPTPQLEYRADGAAGFVVVPEATQLGSPLHITREWVPSVGGGTKQGPLEEAIAAADFMLPTQAGEAVVGHHSMGANPDAKITLPAGSYTEQEFTVQLSMDAKYLTGYELRLTDGGTAPTGTQVARIVLGAQPALQLSAGQRQGVVVVDPKAANAAGAIYPLFAAPTTAPTTPPTTPPTTSADRTLATASPATAPAGAPLYALDAAAVTPVAVPVINPAADPSTDSHGIGAAQCGACHRGHTAKAPDLTKASQQSTLCFSCHSNAGPGKDVESQYALTRPANKADTRDYYSHNTADATTPTRHTLNVNEFEGVDNRHSECADCHNSHKAGTTDSTETLDGWDISGRLAGVTGVAVTNSPTPGGAPTYKALDGVTDPVTREYQLCFKCHSGYTTLLPNIAGKPSTDALDKGKELNPNNPSFHPVEAAGTNQTDKMKASLAGTSPYKLWNFNTTSTVRCLNCHAGGRTGATADPALPQPGSSLQPHTSSNRGILLENYRDRVLKPSAAASATDAAYSAGDFALCYVCHAEAPFANQSDPADGSSNATNFKLHGLHLTGLEDNGDKGTDIDKAGDGQGNAICSECHFRTHSTTNKVGIQTSDDTRLVNFAPNVEPSGGAISWTRAASPGSGSCTLTCHGYEHTARPYSE